MFSLLINCNEANRDFLAADLWELGVEGTVETPTGVRAFFHESADRDMLIQKFPGAQLEDAEERDWVRESQRALQPMLVGRRFYLVPEWREDPAPPGRIPIRVNSGMAFGTGAHESTRLCLEALEDFVKPGIVVADVGTGSGILAEAAKLLGAGRVIACDIDPLAIEVARGNFDRSGLDVELFEGSVQQLETGVADVLIGNLSPEWLGLLAPEWARALKPAGTLILSGVESHDVVVLRKKFQRAGLVELAVREENQWVCLLYSK